jgi:single-strand DNA-binding protein
MNPKVTIVGRIGTDPEAIGTSGVRMRVVTNDRVKNAQTGAWEDRDTSWWTVKAWKTLAEQAKVTLKKGQEVIIVGTIYQESWTDGSGATKTSYEINAESLALTMHSLTKDMPGITNAAPRVVSVSAEDPWKKVNA